MFNSLQEAINLGEKKNQSDGGVPVFELKAVPVVDRESKEVEYEDVIWVKIFNKGDPKNIMERPKRPEDEKRWPDHWKAYLDNESPPIEGIPISDFPNITPAERMRCKSLHLYSVEDIANYPDGQIKDLGGRGHALQKAARDYIDYREGESFRDMRKRLDALEKDNKKLKKELEAKDGNSTRSNTKRGTGDKSAKAKRGNGRGAGSSGKRAATAKDSGKRLARKDWPVLIKEHEFYLVKNQPMYELPDDFGHLIADTAWDRMESRPMSTMTPQGWQEWKSGLVKAEIWKQFRFKADENEKKIFVNPTPSSSSCEFEWRDGAKVKIGLSFEYVSSHWVTASSVGQATITAGSDVILLDADIMEAELKWRWLRSLSRSYADEKFEAEALINQAFAQSGTPSIIDATGNSGIRDYPNIPESNIGL